MKVIDLTGCKIGMLTVVSVSEQKNRHRDKFWFCRCDCGGTAIRRTATLTDAQRTGGCCSCGCVRALLEERGRLRAVQSRVKFHHPHKYRLFEVWQSMKQRCYNPSKKHYPSYGGRGITICDEWRNDSAAFCQWAIASGYQPGLWIERKDVNGNYCPENCSWETPKNQANNKTNSAILEWNGRRQTLAQWAVEVGMPRRSLGHRVRLGWPVERILTAPIRRKKEQWTS